MLIIKDKNNDRFKRPRMEKLFMGLWEFKRIGVSRDKNDERLKAQLLECFGVDLKADIYQGSWFDPSFDYDDVLIGAIDFYDFGKTNPDPLMVFLLFNKLFGRTDVYYEDDRGTDSGSYYERTEIIYNAESMTVRSTHEFYDGQSDYDEYEDNDDANEYDEDEYDEDDYNDEKQKIEFVPMDKGIIIRIVEKTTNFGYTELTALILEKCKDILGTDHDNLTLDDN